MIFGRDRVNKSENDGCSIVEPIELFAEQLYVGELPKSRHPTPDILLHCTHLRAGYLQPSAKGAVSVAVLS
jgi:hypothetical protein